MALFCIYSGFNCPAISFVFNFVFEMSWYVPKAGRPTFISIENFLHLYKHRYIRFILFGKSSRDSSQERIFSERLVESTSNICGSLFICKSFPKYFFERSISEAFVKVNSQSSAMERSVTGQCSRIFVNVVL